MWSKSNVALAEVIYGYRPWVIYSCCPYLSGKPHCTFKNPIFRLWSFIRRYQHKNERYTDQMVKLQLMKKIKLVRAYFRDADQTVKKENINSFKLKLNSFKHSCNYSVGPNVTKSAKLTRRTRANTIQIKARLSRKLQTVNTVSECQDSCRL